MKKINLFNFTSVKHFNLNHNLRALLVLLLFALGIGNVWGFESKPTFSIAKTSDTPNGAGKIYGYRGGGDATTSGGTLYLEGDKLKTGITGWVAAETGMDLAEMTIKQTGGSNDNYNPSTDAGNRPDGYKVLDRATENGDNTVHILHMYYYAKPNPGYEYVGWYSDAAGTTAIAGSTKHYPYPQTAAAAPKKNNSKEYTPSTWDNGDGSALPSKGPYSDFYYLRDAQELTKATKDVAKTVYVKFRVIPRHVVFAGTGFNDVEYTAGGTPVGKSNVESGNITGNIALAITSYDPAKYKFVKWQWSVGLNGTKTDIATTASATYTFVADRGYPIATYVSPGVYSYGEYEKVYIWPIFQEIIDAEATVQIGDADPVPYEHWADAFAAATADGVSGAIVTLKKDISGITEVQTVDCNMTLDLNNHTITGSVNNMFTVSAGEFTLCDNNPSAAGKIVLNISDATTYAVTVNSGAKLIMQSGGVSATNTLESGTSRGVQILSGGTLEMTGGSIYAQSAKNAYALINRGTATIDNGNIQSRAKGTSTKGTGVTSVAFYNVGTSATVNGGTFSAVADSTTSYGVQMNVASKTMTINNAVVNATAGKSGACALRRDAGKILVKDGKYKATSVLNTATTGSIELQGGIYSTYTNVRQSCTTGYDCYELTPGSDWNDGYRFEVIAATANPRVCKILEVGKATSYYTSLSDALAYANNNTGSVMSIIMMAFEHTLPAGNYTLPQRADLIVPYSVDQTGVTGATPVRVTSYSTPSAFRKLIFESGVHLDAFGKIEAGGRQNVSGQGASGCGASSGAYGHIILNGGSSITLESSSTLYAWGFITGSGEIDARRGSKVHEPFQLYGWAGGTNVSGYYSKTFPITEYFIQNIEAPVKYHPGSRLTTATGVYVSSSIVPTDEVNVIGVDGDVAMFLMANEDDSEDTWVRKFYDPATDQQVFEINSSARLGSLQITFENVPLLGTMDIDSRNYNLPLTHNMKIHLLTGSMGITQSTILLPGTEMEVDKEATLAINSGQNLYIFDDAQWGNKVFDGVPAHRIKYRPVKTPDNTIRDISSAAALGDAKLFVHGTFDVQGKLYTTSGGANIYSTNEDAGTIKFTSAAATSNGSVTIYSGTGSSTESVSMVPALLRNKDNSTVDTKNTASGKSFAYTEDKWECWTQDGCFYVDNTNTYYAKPADYVALLNGKTENADHTYTSADNTRTFILVEGCQWWEVELEDAEKGLWHCTHPLNDVYYYYNGSAWEVKKQTVVWKNYDGTTVATYTNVPYKTTPVYNSTTPSRPMDAYYTYDFDGWDPALGPITTDMVYTAKYVSKDRKYTIVFKNEDGSTIETNYCTMGQVPVCSKEPSKEGYNLVWSPTIQAVTGDAEYQATFTNVVAASYLITFKNYNNTETLQSGQVTTGTMPVYNGATPTKPSTEDQKFTWTGWEPALHNVDADAIYTPTFSASPITYTIKWQVNGVIAKQETVNKGVTPSYGSIPTKDATAQYSYAFTGWSPAVAPASKDETYVAQFSETVNTYTITWSINGVETEEEFAYGATPTHAAPTKDPTVDKTFSFIGWSPAITSVTGDVTYTAQFSESPRSYTITWLNDDDTEIDTTPVIYGEVPTHAPASKASTAEYTYTFIGWDNTPVVVTGDATYKAIFSTSKNSYEITWLNDDNSLIDKTTVEYGIIPTHADAEKANTPEYTYVFLGWDHTPVAVTGVATYKATYKEIPLELDLTEKDTLDVTTTVTTTTVHSDALLVVNEGKTLTTTTFIIEAVSEVTDTDEAFAAAQSGSGEAVGNVEADYVYFDLILNNPSNRRWNAFTVPFKVDLRKSGNPIQINGETLTLGRGYDIIYYDGAVRAAEGKTANCWKYVEDEDSVLYPGKAYMIASASRAIQIVRFTKASDAPIMYDGKVAVAENNGASDGVNGGWNGIGNPMMYHTVMNAGVMLCQVHDGGPIGSDGYRTYDMNDKKLVVGKAVFVQVDSDNDDISIVRATDQETIKPQAPRRTRQQIMEDRYDVQIAANGGVSSDRLLVLAEEEKEDRYVILKDLSKAGVSPVRAQMWVDRYGEKLCMNTTALINNKANYPITISAPKSGEYDIYLNGEVKEGTTLYLTYDGKAIWNLAYGGYTASLEKGENKHYGLRVVISKMPTGIEETSILNGDPIRKVVIDDKVFIIRNGEMYSITGQKAQ